MNKYLAPSILSADFYNLEKSFDVMKKNNIKYVHLDVMDGMFVPNLSIGIPVIESINKHIGNDFILDTHLMVERPERYLENFKNAGSNILTIHKEATMDYIEVLSFIKESGMRAGISINPETDVREIDEALKVADLVLIMSVHPGFGGQKFINESLDKVEYLDKMRKENDFKYFIEIDGGINIENVDMVIKKGVDIVVAGSSVFKGDIDSNIKKFNEIIGANNE